jgi:hypothetical protein
MKKPGQIALATTLVAAFVFTATTVVANLNFGVDEISTNTTISLTGGDVVIDERLGQGDNADFSRLDEELYWGDDYPFYSKMTVSNTASELIPASGNDFSGYANISSILKVSPASAPADFVYYYGGYTSAYIPSTNNSSLSDIRVFGARIEASNFDTDQSIDAMSGLEVEVRDEGNADGTGMTGVRTGISAAGGGEYSAAYGLYVNSTTLNSSDVVDLTEVSVATGVYSGGSILDHYGVRIYAPYGDTGGAGITNNYALWIEDQTGGATGLTYNIFSAGVTAKNLIQGQLILGQHLNTVAANNDIGGQITLTAATSASRTFTTAFASAPVCTVNPTSNITALGIPWVTATTTAVTVNVPNSGSAVFNYHCIGNPN